MKKIFIFIMVLAIATGMVTGCSRPVTDSQTEKGANSKYGGVFKMAISVNPLDLNPVHVTDTSSARITSQIFENLVQVDANGEIEPCLAETWTVSENGRLYTFNLRKGVRFHKTNEGGTQTANNGREVKAEDWVWTFNYIVSRDTNSERAYFLDMIKGYEQFQNGITDHLAGVRAKDDYTLEIELDHAFAPFINILTYSTFVVLPREDVEKWGDVFNFHPVGTGPFKFEKWVQDDRVVLSKNDHYWRTDNEGNRLPYLDGLEFRVVPDLAIQWTEFTQGNFDSIEQVDDPYYREAKEKYADSFYEKPEMGIYFYGMAMELEPFRDNKALRQAMNYAIDREALVDMVRDGRGIPAKGVIPPGMFGYNPDFEGYTYDPDKARKLLADAGYPDGIKITLQCHTGGDIHRRIAEALQQQYEKVGIDLEIRNIDPSALYGLIDQNSVSLFNLGWDIEYPDPDGFLYPAFHSKNHGLLGNIVRFSNDDVDRLLEEARVETDTGNRRKLYQEVEKLIVEEAPWVFIYHYIADQVMQPYVKGYELSCYGAHAAQYYKVWFDKQE